MIDPIVRPATRGDAAQLAWLEAESRAALDGQRGADRWLGTHPVRGDSWTAAIEHDRVFVATIDEVIIGYLVLDTSTSIAVVDDVYVTEQARELGFGDALLAAAIEQALAAGASHLEGSALPGDRNTKNLYERAAIKARLITVSVEL